MSSFDTSILLAQDIGRLAAPGTQAIVARADQALTQLDFKKLLDSARASAISPSSSAAMDSEALLSLLAPGSSTASSVFQEMLANPSNALSGIAAQLTSGASSALGGTSIAGGAGTAGLGANGALAMAASGAQASASAAGSVKGQAITGQLMQHSNVAQAAHTGATLQSKTGAKSGEGVPGMPESSSTAYLIIKAMYAIAKMTGMMLKEQSERTQGNMEESESIAAQLKDLRAMSSSLQKDIDSAANQRAAAVNVANAAGLSACPGIGAAASQVAALPYDIGISEISAQKRVMDDGVKDKEGRLKLLGDMGQSDMSNLKYWDNLHNMAWSIITSVDDARKSTLKEIIQGMR